MQFQNTGVQKRRLFAFLQRQRSLFVLASASSALAGDKDAAPPDWQLIGHVGAHRFQWRLWDAAEYRRAAGPFDPQPGETEISSSAPAFPICASPAAAWWCSTRREIPSSSTGAHPSRPMCAPAGATSISARPIPFRPPFSMILKSGSPASPRFRSAPARRRLSTGEDDFGVSLDVSRQFGDLGTLCDRRLSGSWPSPPASRFTTPPRSRRAPA